MDMKLKKKQMNLDGTDKQGWSGQESKLKMWRVKRERWKKKTHTKWQDVPGKQTIRMKLPEWASQQE